MKKHLLFLSILFSFHAISYSAERDFFLSSPEEHSEFIRKALTTAQKSVVIVSPFISERHRQVVESLSKTGSSLPLLNAMRV